MKTFLICLGAISMILLGDWTPLLADDPPAIPADFKVVARYGAGFRSWKSWEATINHDGKVSQTVFEMVAKEERHELELSPADLQALFAKIRAADFFTLNEKYEYGVTDNPTLILTITANKQTRRVSVYAPHYLKDKAEVQRFLGVWDEVLRKVPAPNPEQKPEMYRP